jgi:hypothetical protein
VGYINGRHLRSLSCVSKWIRSICTPSLFQNVSFEFSEEGFDGLEELLQSRLCSYVISFQYVVPQLLRPGKFSSILSKEIECSSRARDTGLCDVQNSNPDT